MQLDRCAGGVGGMVGGGVIEAMTCKDAHPSAGGPEWRLGAMRGMAV